MVDKQVVGMSKKGTILQYNAPLGKFYTTRRTLSSYGKVLTDDEVLVLLVGARSLGRTSDVASLEKTAIERGLIMPPCQCKACKLDGLT
jgi:hypothetical protein